MNLTDNMKARILHALRTKEISKSELSERMGYGNAWVTKLLKPREEGGLKSLDDIKVEALEDFLGIRFLVLTPNSSVSGTAATLSKRAEEDSALSAVLENLLELSEPKNWEPRFFETKEMTKLGQEIIRACFANEDKPGKVAREVLKLVSQ